MHSERFDIDGIPALLLGEWADKVYLFIHGQNGCKEEAEVFAQIAIEHGYQVLSFDLPEHGSRQDCAKLTPWEAIPELQRVMKYAKARYKSISIRANSIGAWLSMMAYADESIEKCLFVSPIPDMLRLIRRMIEWAGVTDAELETAGEIATNFGNTLSWKYLQFVLEHTIENWTAPTAILYAGYDNLVERVGIELFSKQFGCELSVMENGEHWFHTSEQLRVLNEWSTKNI